MKRTFQALTGAGPRKAGWMLVIAAHLTVAVVSKADLITDSPLLPPLDGQYLSPTDVHATYDGPGLQIVLQNIRHFGFSNVVTTPVAGGTQEDFDSVVKGTAGVDFGPDSFFDVFFEITLTGPTSVFVGGNYTPGDLGTFPTEMLALNLTGVTPLGPVQIRESPTQASTGQTSIQDIGGGLYRIDSFFDVFTELSIDGGQSWIPSQGPVRVELAPLPEPSSLILLGCGAIGMAAGLKRRRSREWVRV